MVLLNGIGCSKRIVFPSRDDDVHLTSQKRLRNFPQVVHQICLLGLGEHDGRFFESSLRTVRTLLPYEVNRVLNGLPETSALAEVLFALSKHVDIFTFHTPERLGLGTLMLRRVV